VAVVAYWAADPLPTNFNQRRSEARTWVSLMVFVDQSTLLIFWMMHGNLHHRPHPPQHVDAAPAGMGFFV